MSLLLLMEIECLRRIDAQLGAYIWVMSSADNFSNDLMDNLYTRLVSLPDTTDVQSADDINKICLAFFDDDDAYTVDKGDGWCIDINRKVVSGEHIRCTKCSISFPRPQSKFADKSGRITEISFFEEGSWHKEVYNSKLELITKLCISFLPDSDEKNIVMKKLEDHFG
jgi:hypothetical protein